MSEKNQVVYSRNVIEFVTVANEFCLFVENAVELEKTDFIDKTLKMLSLLNLKTLLLPRLTLINEEGNEKFVTEIDWQVIKNTVSTLLGEDDLYVDYFDNDMRETPEPVTNSVSENIADIYQDLKDFVLLYKLNEPELMNDAIAECAQNFKFYWGYRLVNSLRILHWLQNREVNDEELNSSSDFEALLKKKNTRS